MSAFPADFAWGVATAAYQIEGAPDADGRGTSIWDTFSRTPWATLNGDTGDVACQHYARWRDDLRLLGDLGVDAYRLSIAWPRVLPTGRGAVNAVGLDWYERLIDALLEAGVQPWVTLYHWDMPQPLQNAGGWPARGTADAFVDYVEVVARRVGDRVRHWVTLNEPWCSAFLGYYSGEHAPGVRDARQALHAAHTLLLAHGRAVSVLRGLCPGASVGISLNPTDVEPASDDPRDVAAAQRFDGHLNRWFLDPLYGRGYPADLLAHYGPLFDLDAAQLQEDLASIATPTDFLGVNYYSPTVVRADPHEPLLGASGVNPRREAVTEMGWIVRPTSLRKLLGRLWRDYGVPALAITENGAAYADALPSMAGDVRDPERERYLASHVSAAAAAIQDGVPLRAYFVWTLLDNFEWAWGYARRFGLVHVDFASQQRTMKQSGRWYRDFIASQRQTH